MLSYSKNLARQRLGQPCALGFVLATWSILGCQASSHNQTAVDLSGDVALALTLADGASVGSVAYAIVGPTHLAGTIDVSKSATVSATLGPLAPGDHYSIELTATSSAGYACQGSADPFSVIAHQTTSVSLVVTCHPNRDAGSVQINGAISVCPGIDSLVVNPSETYVGNDVQLAATASPDDSANGFPLTYSWNGVTSADGLGDAVFHCSAPGTFEVSLRVTNGNPACLATQPASSTTRVVTVTCTSSTGALIANDRFWKDTSGTPVECRPITQQPGRRGGQAADAEERCLTEDSAGSLADEDRNFLGDPAGQAVVVLVRVRNHQAKQRRVASVQTGDGRQWHVVVGTSIERVPEVEHDPRPGRLDLDAVPADLAAAPVNPHPHAHHRCSFFLFRMGTTRLWSAG